MRGIREKRFSQKLVSEVSAFLSSIDDDEHLIGYDIAVNQAHVCMLKKQGLISSPEYRKLNRALQTLNKSYKNKKIRLHESQEDVHMNIEYQVKKRVGQIADSLHLARSRNDLIATDIRLYTRQKAIILLYDIIAVQRSLVQHGHRNRKRIVPGYTHLQQAQPVLWPFYLLSIFFKLQRDSDRLCDAYRRINVSPLGACAFAGTAHMIDPEYTAGLLGFDHFADNCMDAVSDRDFLCEVTYICAQIGLHLTSFAEDLITYTTKEFALITLDDAIATGSSIMPHKRNPDICEILRARAGSMTGNLMALFSILKGLPSAYNRDLQETKRLLFDCIDTTHECLGIIPILLSNLHLTPNNWTTIPSLYCASNVVDHMITQGHKFRKAYHTVASCVRQANGNIAAFMKLCAERFHLPVPAIESLLIPENAVKVKHSKNSTGPAEVEKALRRAQGIIKKNKLRTIRLRQAQHKSNEKDY